MNNSRDIIDTQETFDRRTLLIAGGAVAATAVAGSVAYRALLSTAPVFVARNQRYDGPLVATIRDGLVACGASPAEFRGRSVLLKPNHVEGLVERWQSEGLAVGTIKNRMAELRWWAEKIGKQNVIARDNDHYGIGNRQYVTNVSKARQLTGGELARITDPYTAMSLRLQAAFGLRRGESIKIRPERADRGDRLALKDTWTKGGRPREIPIRNAEQRQVLDEAKALAGRGSLIPAERSYVEQLRRFEYQCAAAGAHRIHGHRHQYAQTRYRELTGWAAPAAGGPRSRDLTPSQREADREARLTISEELGHEREQITAVYLGR